MTTKQATKAPIATTVFEVAAHQLHRILSDAVLFVSKDRTVPVLNAVQIKSDKHRVVAVATDRFTLGASKITLTGTTATGTAYDDDGCTILLQTEDVQTLIKMSKTSAALAASRTVTLTMNYDGNVTFKFNSGEQVTLRLLQSDFPKFGQLFPETESAIGHFAMRRDLLARFAKVDGPQHLRMFSSGADRPQAVTIGEDFVALIMPYRLNDADHEWSTPDWL